MRQNAMQWPGAVGMFFASPAKYFAVLTYANGVKRGCWQGWAQSALDATLLARKVFANMVNGGRCAPDALDDFRPVPLTTGQAAAIITGANVADVLDS